MKQAAERLLWATIFVALFLALKGEGGGTPFGPKADRVTYVYEKDDGAVPAAVLVAMDKLNRQGIVATNFEDDTTDGSGDTPEQYKAPKAAAEAAGLPALVVQAGEKVLSVVKSPTTEAEVLEAAK